MPHTHLATAGQAHSPKLNVSRGLVSPWSVVGIHSSAYTQAHRNTRKHAEGFCGWIRMPLHRKGNFVTLAPQALQCGVIPPKCREGDAVKEKSAANLINGAKCKVIGGVHAGKSGTVRDIKTGKTGYVSITVVQSNGERFKTLAKNVVVMKK